MARRAWNKYNVERMEAQRKNVDNLRHSQKWIRRTKQPNMDEGIKNGFHEESLSIF